MGRKIIIIRCLRPPEDIVSMEAWRLVAMGNQALGMRDEDACSLRRKRCSQREEGQVGLDAIVSESLVLDKHGSMSFNLDLAGQLCGIHVCCN